jgi:hypothetical protein
MRQKTRVPKMDAREKVAREGLNVSGDALHIEARTIEP